MITRRQFIAASAATAAAGATGLLALGSHHAPAIAGSSAASSTTTTGSAVAPSNTVVTSAAASLAPAPPALGRVLVVLQLNGGNDGLNTLIPVGASHGRYRDLRKTIGIDNPVALKGQADYGLHPALAPISKLWDAGRLRAVAGVGFPHPNRSHFEAMRWWWNATLGGAGSTGWLGRYFDTTSVANPMQAISLGGSMPGLTGANSAPIMVLDPSSFSLQVPKLTDSAGVRAALSTFGPSYANALSATNLFSKVNKKTPRKAGDLLTVAADLIEQSASTQVIAVSIGGFDTHSGQDLRQNDLLGQVGQGIADFFDQIDASGHGDRVMLMTTSEFGRRAYENGSGGTDHGKASVHFMAGAGITSGVSGAWDLNHLDDGDLPPVIDSRAYLANGINWLGGNGGSILGTDFTPQNLLA